MTLGGTYRIPVLVGLLDKGFVKDLKMDGEPSVSAVKKPIPIYYWGFTLRSKLTGKPKCGNAYGNPV